MAYLKVHYRKDFMLEMLNSVIKNDVKTKEYINDLRKYGINLLKPDIRLSEDKYIIKDSNIIYPLSGTGNISELQVKKILEQRNENMDFFDYVKLLTSVGFTKKDITYLIDASAFDYTGYNHHTLIENIDSAINYAKLSNDLDDDSIEKPLIKEVDEFTKDELLDREYNAFGLYLFNHPVLKYKDNNISTKDIPSN